LNVHLVLSQRTKEKSRILDGYTKLNSTDIVESVLEIIKRTLESGEDVLLAGFDKFCVKKKKERRGRNPLTGEGI
jgi:integration host factor subunit alpha